MCIYSELIREQCIPNKYTTWYLSIISNAQNRILTDTIYREHHHILPKCICKNNLQILDTKNIAVLTAKEHYMCHLLLCKMFNNSIFYKMIAALAVMIYTDPSTTKSRYSSRFSVKYLAKFEHVARSPYYSTAAKEIEKLEIQILSEVKLSKIIRLNRRIRTIKREMRNKIIAKNRKLKNKIKSDIRNSKPHNKKKFERIKFKKLKYKNNMIFARNIETNEELYITFNDMLQNKYVAVRI